MLLCLFLFLQTKFQFEVEISNGGITLHRSTSSIFFLGILHVNLVAPPKSGLHLICRIHEFRFIQIKCKSSLPPKTVVDHELYPFAWIAFV